MWNATLEQRAADMRQRNAHIDQLLHTTEDRLARSTCAAGEARERQLKGLREQKAKQLARAEVLRSTVVEVVVPEDTFHKRFGHPKGARNHPGAEHYPACPHCNGATSHNTIRAGTASGIQRYRCVWCRRTFSGPKIQVRLEPCTYRMVCYHCGSDDTQRLGRGVSYSRTGRMGQCNHCGRKFVQGGLKDFQKYHLLLEKRIADLNLPGDVEAELLQTACEDVLTGKGYCWTVELDTKKAWKNARGEYNQRGSDHPEFKRQTGQAPEPNIRA
jgi:hypothetical protein